MACSTSSCARARTSVAAVSARDASRPFDGDLDLGHGVAEHPVELGALHAELPLCDPQLERERDEPLLRAVVEVALEATPLGVTCGNDPAARRAHFGELRPHLRREALVFQHKGGRGANRFHQPRLV
jgi:hypothetical protein